MFCNTTIVKDPSASSMQMMDHSSYVPSNVDFDGDGEMCLYPPGYVVTKRKNETPVMALARTKRGAEIIRASLETHRAALEANQSAGKRQAAVAQMFATPRGVICSTRLLTERPEPTDRCVGRFVDVWDYHDPTRSIPVLIIPDGCKKVAMCVVTQLGDL